MEVTTYKARFVNPQRLGWSRGAALYWILHNQIENEICHYIKYVMTTMTIAVFTHTGSKPNPNVVIEHPPTHTHKTKKT